MIKKLKLYRISTVISYARKCPGYARRIAEISGKKNLSHIKLTCDVFLSFVLEGFDFNDYCTFRLWDKSKQERDQYISFRKNDALIPYISTPEIYKIFRDKHLFNIRFEKWISRQSIEIKLSLPFEEKISIIKDFVKKHNTVILKPSSQYGGTSVVKVNDKMLDILPLSGGEKGVVLI